MVKSHLAGSSTRWLSLSWLTNKKKYIDCYDSKNNPKPFFAISCNDIIACFYYFDPDKNDYGILLKGDP